MSSDSNHERMSNWFDRVSLYDRVRFYFQSLMKDYTKVYMNVEWEEHNVPRCFEQEDRDVLREFRSVLQDVINKELEKSSPSLNRERIVNLSANDARAKFEPLAKQGDERGEIGRRALEVIDCLAQRIMYDIPGGKGDAWIEEYVEAAYVALYDYLYTDWQRTGLIP